MHYRFCKKCQYMRPPRSHHCSVCGQCVMRMDHHCPWAGNCIGLKNHKYFFCFLFWTIMACLHVFISSKLMNQHLKLRTTIEDRKYFSSFGYLHPMIAWLLSLTFAIAVFILYCLHRSYLYNNETTIEASPFKLHNPFRLPKDMDNFQQIMGPRGKYGWLSFYIPFEVSEYHIDS